MLTCPAWGLRPDDDDSDHGDRMDSPGSGFDDGMEQSELAFPADKADEAELTQFGEDVDPRDDSVPDTLKAKTLLYFEVGTWAALAHAVASSACRSATAAQSQARLTSVCSSEHSQAAVIMGASCLPWKTWGMDSGHACCRWPWLARSAGRASAACRTALLSGTSSWCSWPPCPCATAR